MYKYIVHVHVHVHGIVEVNGVCLFLGKRFVFGRILHFDGSAIFSYFPKAREAVHVIICTIYTCTVCTCRVHVP